MAGKGDRYRPVDRKKYEENYARIFGQKKENDEHRETPPAGNRPAESAPETSVGTKA
jgi:hypothetical protein